MQYETVIVGALETNCYLLYCEQTRECAVVDPGAEPEKILRAIGTMDLKPVILINTHGHVDHVGANRDIKERFDVPLCIHAADAPMLGNILNSAMGFFIGAKKSPPPDRFLEEGEEIAIGESRLRILHTPGHSPGSVSLVGDGILLSGDVLFCGGVGRTDLPGGSWEKLEDSIRNKIFVLDEGMIVLPGHGPHTSVGEEKAMNPFVR
ncbi:MAG: MBL fold metallo-hydrolase [Candidatus Aminicenantales bacterium]